MKRIFLVLVIICEFAMTDCIAQEDIPCASFVADTETEMHELGTGRGETILEATTGAVSNALGRMKKRLKQTNPELVFTYETKAVSTEEGEQVEVETTLGQPNIICNEVQMPEESSFVVYIVLSINVSNPQDNTNE